MKKENIITILILVGILVVFNRLDYFIRWNTKAMDPTTLAWINAGSYLIFAVLILVFQYLLVFKRSDENKAILYVLLGAGLVILFMSTPLFLVWFNLPKYSFPRTLVFFPEDSFLRYLFRFPMPSRMMRQAGSFVLLTSIFCLLSKKNCVSNK